MNYYINGKLATEAEAIAQEEENRRIMSIEDPAQWLKEAAGIKFIIAADIFKNVERRSQA